MTRISTVKLIEIAKYYTENNITIDELAAMNNMSGSTLKRYFSGNDVLYLPKEWQDKVDTKKKRNWIEGKATYGNKGHISFTKEQLVVIANILIENNYTLTEIASTYGVTAPTIYNLLTEENIGKELYLKVLEVYKKNKGKNLSSLRSNNKK